ncbi:MAG: PASTA domain-containing protein [Clostridia bacterium]|nr:PASTA domain-containing protein [Clostridiales bacterium]MBQ6715991.1 PASTA domain-containing protein [Clostridia bacterium]
MVPTGPVIRRRIVFTMGVFFVLFLVMAVRLFYLTVIDSQNLQQKAKSQWTMEAIIQPKRGSILDRNGSVLAQSATAYTLSASPRRIENKISLASVLSPLLEMDVNAVYARISDTTKGGVTVKRQLDYETVQRLKLMMAESSKNGENLYDGLYLDNDSKRYYPNGAFATQLLGLTTIDGVGQAGLESALNNYLMGKTGRVVQEIDGKGKSLGISSGEYVSAVNGSDVYLTIDKSIQGYAEKAAREAMEVNGAQAVRVLVMNPDTGEILASVSKPDYDPNDPPRDDVKTLTSLMRNTVISDAYEPGSTFKMITMSACLEEKLTNLGEHFFCSGSVYVEGGRVRCWGNPHGSESLTEALENSCNPVFVELGLRLGTETFYDYLEAFGFGEKTGVDIPGEGAGIVIARNRVKRVDIARIGFGQSIAVTPLQLLSAACAVVNGGKLMQPYVIKEIRSEDGTLIEKTEPTVRATPISEETSSTMRKMLESVVTNGGGKNAYIAGYHVGGKTGTAQVYVDGKVSSDMHIGSFLGFAPMDHPKVAVLFIVDRADLRPDYGSVTAAPFARDILYQSLVHMGVSKDEEIQLEAVPVPSVEGESLSGAIRSLKNAGFRYIISGDGSLIASQLPAPGASMQEGSIVVLYTNEKQNPDPDAFIEVPDVTGLSMQEANQVLLTMGLTMTVEGSGLACSQLPEAGERVFPTQNVEVRFELP